MSSSEFLSLLTTLTSRPSTEDLANLSDEAKLKTVRVGAKDITCEYIGVTFSGHERGNTDEVLTHQLLPSWNFTGNISPDLVDGQELLIAPGLFSFSPPGLHEQSRGRKTDR